MKIENLGRSRKLANELSEQERNQYELEQYPEISKVQIGIIINNEGSSIQMDILDPEVASKLVYLIHGYNQTKLVEIRKEIESL